MAETNFWQQIWEKEKPWPTGRPDTSNSLPSNIENDLRARGLITNQGQMYDPHGDNYIGPSNTGKAKVDLASEAAMIGLTYAAVKNPGLALEAIGADSKSFNDQSLYQIDRLRMANALGSVNRKVKGAKRIGQALKTIIENPRQAELAGTGIVGDIGRISDDFTPSNVFQSSKADLGQKLRTGTDTYTPNKEVLDELDESMQLFGQKMDKYNELKKARKPFIGLKSPEAKKLAKKLNTKYIREGDVNTALRQARDSFSAAPKSAVREYIGEMAELGYDAGKGKPGGKPSTGSGLHQHHIDANVEAYSRTRLLNKLGTTFKVQAQRYIASVYKMAPARARANMANIPGDLHLGDLHPWLKSMGIETYWRDLWKANPRGISKQQMVGAIDNYFDEVVFPSLVKMDNLVKKSPTKISETHLPQNVVEAARKRLKELTNQPIYKSKYPKGSTTDEIKMEKRIEDLFIKGSESKPKVWGEALE